jgi:hypothetical protein
MPRPDEKQTADVAVACSPAQAQVSAVPSDVYERFEADYSERLSRIMNEVRCSGVAHTRVEFKYRLD